MGRPRKDPSLPKAEKVVESFRLPIGPGRVVIIKFPVGGLSNREVELVRAFVGVLLNPLDAEDQDSELLDHEGWRRK